MSDETRTPQCCGPRILLRGAGFVNKGAEAMLRTTQSEYEARGFQVCIEIPPGTSAECPTAAGLTVLSRANRPRRRNAITFTQHAVANPKDILSFYHSRHSWFQIDSIVDEVDAIIDISGFAYADNWGAEPSLETLKYVLRCQRRGKPYIFLPQAWGPFSNSIVRNVCARLYAAASLTFARDAVSRSHIADAVGIPIDSVRMAPDIAFQFRGHDVDVGSSILRKHGFELAKPCYGVAPNMRIYERTEGSGRHNQYIQALLFVCRYLSDLGGNVILIPHEIKTGTRAYCDDRSLCSLLETELQRASVRSITDIEDAESIKSIIGNCEFVIGSRFHVLIAALSSGVPVLPIGWSHKYKELLRLFGLEKWITEHGEISVESLKCKLNKFQDDSREIRYHISTCLPAIRTAVKSVFDEVADCIEQSLPPERRAVNHVLLPTLSRPKPSFSANYNY